MKELIKSIIADSQLEVKEIKFYEIDTLFAYFGDKEDFFIFIFCSYFELTQKINKENSNNIEYALNLFTHEYKQQEILQQFSNRNIDNNLSLIIVLASNEENLSHLYKIEENSIISKKYILPYSSDEFSTLNNKIKDPDNVIDTLNYLSIEYSNLLQDKDNEWYKFLLRLFIKIPFLNYKSTSYDSNYEKLEKLDNIIISELSKEQHLILKKINEEYDPNNTNIESFIFSNFTDNEQ